MSIDTFSLFYYGFDITSENQNFPFDEGSGELNAQVAVGSYTLSEFVVALQSALNAAAVTRAFTVSVDRSTRLITISADGAFDILLGSGTTRGSSCFGVAGFNGLLDRTGQTSYVGSSQAGDFYEPQFVLQDYVSKDDFVESNDASVNLSTSGRVEVIRFGLIQFYRLNIKYITDVESDGKVIKNNQSGLADARRFLREITKRVRFEFMPDIADPDTFDKVILEEIRGNSTATGFELRELTSQNLPNFYETGRLTLRVVE